MPDSPDSNTGTPRPASTRPERPEGWPTAERPRRVAVLGWARLSAQAREGSGYNLSASELAAGLALSGHEVFYLRSGMQYSFRPGMFIRHEEIWRGIACDTLVNSPNLAPAVFNFTNMAPERECRAHASMVVRWLDRVRAEVVHIHSMEGYGLDLTEAIRATGRPVVVTTHNYWFACPQVDLLYQESHVCTDYEGGRRCESCVHPAPAPRARLRRRLEQSAYRWFGPTFGHFVRTSFAAARPPGGRSRSDDQNGENGRKRRRGPVEQFDTPPDPEIALGFEVDDAPTHPGTIDHGLVIDEDEIRDPGLSPIDQNERFLRADHHLNVLNNYGKRRVEGIEALNKASLVTPPSRFMLRVYESMGVDASRLRHVRLGQPHFDQINRRARRSPYYEQRPWTPEDSKPLRLAFFGTVRPNKGLEVLTRAIPLLERDIRQRCQFHIRAGGGEWPFRKRLSAFPEISVLPGYDPIQLLGAWGEYDVGILPHIWFENSPLVLLEHLHAGKFVLSSRLGGPPEWITEPEGDRLGNGLLFPAGDPDALAECIRRIVRGEVHLPSPAEVHRVSPLWSYPAHVDEVCRIYESLLSDRPLPESRPARTETDVSRPASSEQPASASQA